MDTKDSEDVINANINDYRFFNANMNANAVNINDFTENNIENKIDYNSDKEVEPLYIFCDDAIGKDLFPPKRFRLCGHRDSKKTWHEEKSSWNKLFSIFYQLAWPIYKTEKPVINEDKRLFFYAKVHEWSNLYTNQIGLGGNYGHEFENVTPNEILHHDGYIMRDWVWWDFDLTIDEVSFATASPGESGVMQTLWWWYIIHV